MTQRVTASVFYALLGAAAVGLVCHSLVFDFVTDDAFISFVYSRNLAEHGQLVFNLGERVEGYTNFLWTVLLAGLMTLGLQPELMSRVLGTSFATATFLVAAAMVRKLRSGTRSQSPSGNPGSVSPWDAGPALLLALLPGYACWASGGLETQMFTFFLTLGLCGQLGALLEGGTPSSLSGLWLALAALTRPEGNLFFALLLAHRAWQQARHWRMRGLSLPSWLDALRAELAWAWPFIAIVTPHFLWRRWYYGWWLPNTFYIKASGGRAAWSQGGYYLTRVVMDYNLWAVALIAVGALIAMGKRRKEADARLRTLVGLAAWLVGVFALYVASVGGDFMGLYRFVLPVFPLIMVVGVSSTERLLGGRGAIAALFAVLLLGVHGWSQARVTRRSLSIGADRGIDTPGYLRWYTADRALIGKWFGQHAQPDDFAAVGGAGAQVYYSRMRSLDCFGLSDEYIAHRVPASSSRPGHQKYAPLEYQLSRKPTIITSNYYRIAGEPYVPSAVEAATWHQRGYHYVSVRIEGLSAPYYSFLKRIERRVGPLPPLEALD